MLISCPLLSAFHLGVMMFYVRKQREETKSEIAEEIGFLDKAN